MADTKKKRSRFWLGLLIFAGCFLAITAAGLAVFWDFIASYEVSRPQSTIALYMETLTPEKIAQLDTATAEKCDSYLQPMEEYLQVVRDDLQKITYAKNTKLSTDDQQVYMILNSGKSIGSVTMTVVETDKYGLDRWQVTQESYDLSYLMGQTVSVTVPDEYYVYANGELLDSKYVTDFGIHYTGLEDYYKKYELPTRCTYTTGVILGTPELTITDAAGNAVNPEELEKLAFLPVNCTEGEQTQLKEFVDTFLYYYVRYTTAAGGQWKLLRNYNALMPYIRVDSNLHMRVKDAMDGMGWVLDRKASITELVINGMVNMGDGRYMVDMSYVVDGTTQSGAVRNTANIKLVVVDEGSGFKAESMINY